MNLRNQGYSYLYISGKTGLSKSTLSDWLGQIPYTPNTQTVEALGRARSAAGKRKADLKQASYEELRQKAKEDIGNISGRDLFMFGLGLYLGEGGKTSDIVRIANSEPRIIQAAVAWFRLLGVSPEQFAARVHLYPDSDIAKCVEYWSQITGIPKEQFYECSVDTRQNKKVNKQGKLPYGTLHLGVKSMGNKEYGVLFFRRIKMWSEEMLQKANAGLV